MAFWPANTRHWFEDQRQTARFCRDILARFDVSSKRARICFASKNRSALISTHPSRACGHSLVKEKFYAE
jgi:hypothetical protein